MHQMGVILNNIKMNAVTVVNVVTLLTFFSFSHGIPICDNGFFYDRLKGDCVNCAKLCYYPTAQNTRNDCDTNCPGYLQTDGPTDKTDCPKGSYFDPHVGYKGKCELCSLLCYAHESTGNTEDCKSKCPGFLQSTSNNTRTDGLRERTRCHKGSYFDPHVGYEGKCEPCSVLCYAHEITRNTENCKSKCPDEYASQVAKASRTDDPLNATEHKSAFDETGDPSHKNEGLVEQAAVVQQDKENNDADTKSEAVLYISSTCLVITVVGLVGFFLYKKGILKRIQLMKNEKNSMETSIQYENLLKRKIPVQETSRKTCETKLVYEEVSDAEVGETDVGQTSLKTCETELVDDEVSQAEVKQTSRISGEMVEVHQEDEHMGFGELHNSYRCSYYHLSQHE